MTIGGELRLSSAGGKALSRGDPSAGSGSSLRSEMAVFLVRPFGIPL
jgi:hypothetical protein